MKELKTITEIMKVIILNKEDKEDLLDFLVNEIHEIKEHFKKCSTCLTNVITSLVAEDCPVKIILLNRIAFLEREIKVLGF